MRAVRQADRGRGAADFFHCHTVGEVAHIAAAVFLAHRDTEQAQITEFLPHIHRKFVVAIDGFGARCQFGLSHIPGHIAQHVDLFAEAEIECGVRCVHGLPFQRVLLIYVQDVVTLFMAVSASVQRASASSSSRIIVRKSSSCVFRCSRFSRILSIRVCSCWLLS